MLLHLGRDVLEQGQPLRDVRFALPCALGELRLRHLVLLHVALERLRFLERLQVLLLEVLDEVEGRHLLRVALDKLHLDQRPPRSVLLPEKTDGTVPALTCDQEELALVVSARRTPFANDDRLDEPALVDRRGESEERGEDLLVQGIERLQFLGALQNLTSVLHRERFCDELAERLARVEIGSDDDVVIGNHHAIDRFGHVQAPSWKKTRRGPG